MALTRSQLIAVAVVIGLVLIFGLIFAGVIPGLRSGNREETLQARLEMWGVGDTSAAFDAAIADFKTVYPGVEVKYTAFADKTAYENSLLNALAENRGPDIFVVENSELNKNINKIVPAPSGKITLLTLRNLFPQIIEKDFVRQGSVYGLPLSIDALVLFYNRNLLDQAAQPVPVTWEDFFQVVKNLKIFYEGKDIRPAALGGSNRSVARAGDILALLFLQSETSLSRLSGENGRSALSFYTQFADPNSEVGSYDDSFPNALDFFSQNKVVLMIDYGNAAKDIRVRNNFLNFATALAPQPAAAVKYVSYPKYFAYAVSRGSRNATVAWDFILNLTAKSANAKSYLAVSGKSPALRSLITEEIGDPDVGAVSRSVLFAEDFGVSADALSGLFSRAIELVVNERRGLGNALDQIQSAVYGLIEQ